MFDELMDQLRINQVQMGEELGVSQQAISLWKHKGYIPIRQIDRVRRYITKQHEEFVFQARQGFFDGGFDDKSEAKLRQMVNGFVEVLEEMKTRLLKEKNKATATIRASAKAKASATVHKFVEAFNEGADVDQLRALIEDDMDRAKAVKRSALFDKADRMSYYQAGKDTMLQGVARKSRELADFEALERHKLRRELERREFLLVNEAKRLDKEMLYILMKQLPGQTESRIEVHGRLRRVDYLSPDGVALEVTNLQVGRTQTDWRPLMTRIFEMAVLVKSPDVPEVKQGHVFIMANEEELALRKTSEEEVYNKIKFLAHDAALLGVDVSLVFGQAPDLFATVVEKILGREYDPTDWHIPMLDDQDNDQNTD
jgi:hypothetical protein